MIKKFKEKYFSNITKSLNQINLKDFESFLKLVKNVKKNNKKIIIVGNGGSAAMASHVAVDFTKTCKIRSINFNEADLITCFSNDYGYENWLKESLKAYASKGDLLILISSSGNSKNIINAGIQGKKIGLKIITFTGFSPNNKVRKIGNINFWVNNKTYNIVEITHQSWLLAAVDFLAVRR